MTKTQRHQPAVPPSAPAEAVPSSQKGPQPLDPRLLGQVSGGAKGSSTIDLPKGTWSKKS